MGRTAKLRRAVDVARQQIDHWQRVVQSETEALEQARKRVEWTDEARSHIQGAAQAVQTEAHRQVAGIVSKCMSAVFGGGYELQIEFDRKRGRTEAEFSYKRGEHRLNPRTDSGGVMQVASLALRLASIILTAPPARRLLVLDEPFSGLSQTNLKKMGRLMEVLSEELGVQWIVVTHDPELRIGEVLDL